MKTNLRAYQTEEDYWRIRQFLREVSLLNDRHDYSWSLLRWDYWRWHINMNIFHLNLEDAYHTHKQTFTINGKQLRITIPAGIENGQRIKLKGHGGPGTNGGPDGDLYITFNISEHPRFKRLGNDLYITTHIDLYTAVLGGEVTVDTLGGKVKMKVNPGTQQGSKSKLRGKGFPVYKQENTYGDLYVSWHVDLPTHLTAKQQELFEQLSRLS